MNDTMTPERKEKIRKTLAGESPSCAECGSSYKHIASDYDHDYVRPTRVEDELLAALDSAEEKIELLLDYVRKYRKADTAWWG